jgi:cold shock CspA family protein
MSIDAAYLRGLDRADDVYMPLHALLRSDVLPPQRLEIGASVEYGLVPGGGRPTARNVRLLPPGTVTLFEFALAPVDAVVVRAPGQ